MISLFLSLIVLIMLTVWGLRTRYPVAFQMAFIVSYAAAWRWYDAFDTTESLAISVVLVFYAFVMAGAALVSMFGESKG